MRFNKLDLNLLVVLNALLTESSVKKAAEKLYLSPAATSNALARLRNYFEDELLIQIGKRMVLTPKAIALKKPVSVVLLQIQSITTTVPTFNPRTCERRVTIEASDYVMNVFLADMLRHIWQCAPFMQFDLRLVNAKSHTNLENGEIDLLITPEAFTATGHPAERLFDDDWSCVTCAHNSQLHESLSVEDYMTYGHVTFSWNNDMFSSYEERLLKQFGYTRHIEVIAPNFAVLPQFLIGTRRIATLQTRLAHKLASQIPLRVFSCPLPIPHIVEKLQWRKHDDFDPVISWVCKTMHYFALNQIEPL
ncbi:LysR family transcriptional regulator [Serratia sp. PF2-63]|uniref:LysR family transcriptional regulator n=1 Tax=unclassified Serratia (in: enterobacteria) TaxID=2647522 RepID=UPI0024AEE60F|nr:MULTISPECIES: LysR family transcriptional regulator [unclassified Serratia (in: enterobacteria)]EMB6252939.1 LysR family transcriptional regulator [Serratia marcescens]MDI6974292.1 LysR family transcriptional regulator [Serratia sp. Se-RSBMAAmG]MDI9262576.1 LysR family transcriptional regulator [Serratia sp. PF2-63]MDI9270923.1 LysR family transcriptional regulator [Serratia sp. PF-27]